MPNVDWSNAVEGLRLRDHLRAADSAIAENAAIRTLLSLFLSAETRLLHAVHAKADFLGQVANAPFGSSRGTTVKPVALRRASSALFAVKPFGRLISSARRLRGPVSEHRDHYRFRRRGNDTPPNLVDPDATARGGLEMLRIEKESDGSVTTIRVIGRLRSSDIKDLGAALKDVESRVALDLSELLLVDLGVVRFFGACEDQGVKLRHCPRYIREWISREGPAR
jgi:hypothetical protein